MKRAPFIIRDDSILLLAPSLVDNPKVVPK